MKYLILVAAALCAPFLAFAQDPVAAKRRFLSVDHAEEWSGVGRLNSNGGFCTAALIRPDTLLTAAHCIIDERTNLPIPVSRMQFVAGSRKGYHTAFRRVVSATAHPDWSGHLGAQVKVPGDIAVVKLESPVTRIEGRSYPLGTAPQKGDDVVLLSYGRDREDALSIQEPCQVVEKYQKSASLNCDVTFGASGSPVFAGGRIVGVISAMGTGNGRKLAYAVMVDGAIQDLIDTPVAGAAPAAPAQPGPRASTLFKSAPKSGGLLPGGKAPPKQ